MTVSIIIPNHNHERFLGEAIESALGQSRAPTEIVVVDDGSTDRSVEVARGYPVRLIEQSNSGVALARNRGAREATGEHVVFLDADDLLAPNFLERTMSALEAAAPGIAYAYTAVEKFGLETGRLFTRPFDGEILFEGNYIPVSALLRRAVFLEAGGFDPSWPAFEDYELWARLYVRGHSGIYVDEPLLRYRFHGRSRNTLTRDERDDLHVRLSLTYPWQGVRWIMQHKGRTLRSLLRRCR